MIDIETLSSQSDAAVISIGLVGFDEERILYRESFAIDEHDWHGHVDPRTVKWWMEQGAEAQAFSFRNEFPKSADLAAFRLSEFAARFCQDECWANGPQFDLVVLRNWWRRVKGDDKLPIYYRAYRDCRTLWRAAEARGADLTPAWTREGIIPHHPLSDAETQACAVQIALKALA
jgi:hypothetical protein